ncbi:bacillithiol system redox-active protein YtxJ [Chryseosolibacter indicus]|uniref:Bacillithiol system redox-active protein YtxJ n=1 Tax=Chryseosolibacter indicus TaxID=2782351 RepID=A0ABS5VNP3_9BACT|nr:bacillithiol system redox-active protein YtxJ [Chryseosolibacter indicus]MBT1702638.1 bacillithiol system redox-active protein YtxJ [Chryseosolibacter indicus]
MNWIELTNPGQLEEIKKMSENTPILIFKHSTRCSTSRMALDRLERNWNQHEMTDIKPFFLDLLSYRQISNLIADQFGIQHESPQVLVISKGQSVLDLSHFEIEYDQIKKKVKEKVS